MCTKSPYYRRHFYFVTSLRILSIVGIGTKSYGFRKFHALKINLAIGFIRKNQLECIGKAVMMLYLGQTKRQVEYFDLQPILKISKFTCISSASQPACLPACLPAVRPGCARCRAPEISHDNGNGGGFMKLLFRRRFTHCAMAIPFIHHSFPCSSIFL